MPNFIQRDPSEVDNLRMGPRGRVSYPILKAFMETNYYLAEVDLSDTNRKAVNLQALLKIYISRHELPVKPFMRGGKLYLIRLDLDEEGNKIEDWKESSEAEEEEVTEAPEISPAVVKKRSGG